MVMLAYSTFSSPFYATCKGSKAGTACALNHSRGLMGLEACSTLNSRSSGRLAAYCSHPSSSWGGISPRTPYSPTCGSGQMSGVMRQDMGEVESYEKSCAQHAAALWGQRTETAASGEMVHGVRTSHPPQLCPARQAAPRRRAGRQAAQSTRWQHGWGLRTPRPPGAAPSAKHCGAAEHSAAQLA